MKLVLDFAGGRPAPEAIKRMGYAGVIRYVTAGGFSLPNKQITLEEYLGYVRAGIEVALVLERDETRMLGGRGAGILDAMDADAYANKLGHPPWKPIYFACDWDATEAQQPLINEYLDGASTVIGRPRVGLYAGYWPLSRALDAGKATYGWQTVAWSGVNREGRARILQTGKGITIDGIPCDINEVRAEDYGQYPNGGTMTTVLDEVVNNPYHNDHPNEPAQLSARDTLIWACAHGAYAREELRALRDSIPGIVEDAVLSAIKNNVITIRVEGIPVPSP